MCALYIGAMIIFYPLRDKGREDGERERKNKCVFVVRVRRACLCAYLRPIVFLFLALEISGLLGQLVLSGL